MVFETLMAHQKGGAPDEALQEVIRRHHPNNSSTQQLITKQPHTVPKSIIQSAEEFEVFALHIVFIHTPRAGHPHFTQRTQSKGLTFKA